MKGHLVTFEGIDGCGKSTQAELLRDFLDERGQDSVLVGEPGGTHISVQIRNILLNPENRSMNAVTESILFSASRAQLTYEVILPNLEKETTVLCDRFVDSSLAYQGYGRGLPIEWLKKINEFATARLVPGATIFLDIPVRTALERLRGKGTDRMEKEGDTFLQRVRNGYQTLARENPERYIVVDGAMNVKLIHRKIVQKLEKAGSLRKKER
ncbi:MAG: dTMP kinase [Candidatus Neomarinimicrobiota bacterium]